MNNEIPEFFKEVSKNEKLRKEISEAEKGLGKNLSKEEVEDFFQQKFLPIAKKYGFNFTYEELREYRKSMEPKGGQKLGVDLLEGVPGGSGCGCVFLGAFWGCGCVLIGGASD